MIVEINKEEGKGDWDGKKNMDSQRLRDWGH